MIKVFSAGETNEHTDRSQGLSFPIKYVVPEIFVLIALYTSKLNKEKISMSFDLTILPTHFLQQC